MAGPRPGEDEQIEIRYQHPLDRGGWTIIYHAITLDQRIPHGALRLYLLINKYAQQRGSAWPRRSTLARDLGVSEWTIWRWLNALEKVGLIIRKKEKFIGPTTIYLLDPHEAYFQSLPNEECTDALFAHTEECTDALFAHTEECTDALFAHTEECNGALPKSATIQHEEIIREEEEEEEEEGTSSEKNSDLIAQVLEEARVFPKTAREIARRMDAQGITPEEARKIWMRVVDEVRQGRGQGGRVLTDEEIIAMAVARLKCGNWRQISASDVIRRAQFGQAAQIAQPAIPAQKPQEPHDGIWQQVLRLLEGELTRATFSTWLATSRFLARDGNTLVVEVSGPAARDWLESRLRGVIERAIMRVSGERLSVRFVVAEG